MFMRILICILLFSMLPIYADENQNMPFNKEKQQRLMFSIYNSGLEVRALIFPFAGLNASYDYFFLNKFLYGGINAGVGGGGPVGITQIGSHIGGCSEPFFVELSNTFTWVSGTVDVKHFNYWTLNAKVGVELWDMFYIKLGFTPFLYNFNNTPDMKPAWNFLSDIYTGSIETDWMKYTIDIGFIAFK